MRERGRASERERAGDRAGELERERVGERGCEGKRAGESESGR